MFFVLLLLLLVSASQASHYFGAMMTYYPKETRADGSISVVLRYKLNFHSCSTTSPWTCSGNCGVLTQNISPTKVEEIINKWCQTEGVETRLLGSNSALQSVFSGGNWIINVQNINFWKAVTGVELRNRSDIGGPNTSPQTTILPALRFPSNCSRNFTLLAFDPDGDEVKCRYANGSLSECQDCTPPSVLSLSSSCTLGFSSLSRSNDNTEESYAVQLVMEDFSSNDITLTQTNGVQELKNASEAISKIPVQFALTVVPGVPSCIEGEYLPRFLPPTPEHRAHLYTPVNQNLEIPVIAEASLSTITGLLFSGPYNVGKNTSESGNYTLTWTPSAAEDGQSHSICFVIQASFSGNLFDSELRCVIVTVGDMATLLPTTTTTATPTTAMTPLPVNTPSTPTSAVTSPPINVTLAPTSAVTSPPVITSLEPITSTPNTVTTHTPTITSPTTSVTFGPTTPLSTGSSTTLNTPTLFTNPLTTSTTTMIPTSTSVPGPNYVVVLKMKISTTLSLETDSDAIVKQIKDEFIRRGLPSDITLRLLGSGSVKFKTQAHPGD